MTLRKDILAVMDRDPAVRTSPDVILYFKGFQALQTHRVAHWLWSSGRSTLALFVQSRANTGEENLRYMDFFVDNMKLCVSIL